jgi:hypothetical protein
MKSTRRDGTAEQEIVHLHVSQSALATTSQVFYEF